jgi:LCP family protein required for cell wall assembly
MIKKQINLMAEGELPRVVVKQKNVSNLKKKHWVFRLLVFILVIIALFSTNVIFSKNSLITNLGRLSFWEGVTRLMIGKDKILKGEIFDRINILILGMGGAAHEGPYLTDTIILASLKPSAHQVGLLSIPRDLYVPIPNYGWRKINSANALGVAASKDGGLLTSQVVSNIFDTSVHYWIRVDFKLFKDIINELGGIEVEVEKSFVDYQFPDANFSYRTISFEKGWQTMDGETALQFARSRHGTNGENSDFARAKRQQKIIFAIKKKLTEENVLSQPRKILSIYNSLQNNFSSNLDFSQSIRLVKIVLEVNFENIITKIIEAEPNGPLISEINSNGAFVLKTKTGDFKELADLAKNLLEPTIETPLFGQRAAGLTEEPVALIKQKSKLIILNGTYIPGLAQEAKEKLSLSEFEIVQVGNASTRNYKKNIVYPIKENFDQEHLTNLCQIINGETEQLLDKDLKNIFDQRADFLIILGDNY